MDKKKWTSVYQDIEDVSRNKIFLENYIHSSTDSFELGKRSGIRRPKWRSYKRRF